MVLSRRTLKRMENLGSVCSFDTDKEVATLNMHFADVSEIIDARMSSENRLVVNEETLELLYNGLELVPNEFRVNYDISIKECQGYDLKTIEEAFMQSLENRDYRENIGKEHKNSIMCVFVVIGLIFLLISNYVAANNMLAWAGLSVSAINKKLLSQDVTAAIL